MNSRSALIFLLAGLFVASCSEKSSRKAVAETERKENDEQPREDQIGEDCVAFVRATKIAPAQTAAADCPGCSAAGSEVLAFRQMTVDRLSCAATTCEVTVTLRASFNPGAGGTIGGGLTAWIPQEQRREYLSGDVPEGEQVYRVKIIYKRKDRKSVV